MCAVVQSFISYTPNVEMSSPEPDEPPQNSIFLPSMLRKNGGKFGATLGKALMNKFRPPAASQAEGEETEWNERPQDINRHTIADIPDSGSTDNFTEQDNNKDNTLDYVKRNKILKDVRSKRPKAPITRPKSAHILKEQLIAAEIPLDDDELSQPPTSSPEPEEINSTSSPLVKMESAQEKAQVVHRETPIGTKAERPVAIGNIECIRQVSPENSLVENGTICESKLDQDEARKKVLAKGLTYLKSTEILSRNYELSEEPVSSSEQKKTSETMRNLKILAVSLAKNVKSMEGEINSMKTQLSNLITLIAELENDKK